ncbi:dGTP triphosphohydrolase [Seonamhaeicola aphaedonensis]|uniref:dGTPase n=1 Tax=Seonamhaeicola aphaedonensis TaxID=1461338 RepID=A0A3D9HMD9_9FLAO|nr:dNTP triphosphohydrolase [Seonamhaeicola aphaedonensis]RED50660.1 dGTPase [Seonamhaeicola aphaedonensis]
MNWEQLLSLKRFGDTNKRLRKEQDETRVGFEVDYDRIIFSSEFRSLQDKTQVIPLSQTDFVHTRLTHSLEVSVVGRSLGRKVGKKLLEKYPHLKEVFGYQVNDFGAIVAAAALAHDIGNPPFGHSGEKAIGEFFKTGAGLKYKGQLTDKEYQDLCDFEGNANGFKIITQKNLRLSYATLGAFMKYPKESLPKKPTSHIADKKYGFFQSEKKLFDNVAKDLGLLKRNKSDISYTRHPLTFLVEAADDICYTIIDFEDGINLGLIDEEFALEYLSKIIRNTIIPENYYNLSSKQERIGYLRALAIGTLIDEAVDIFMTNEDAILNGTFDCALLDKSKYEAQIKDIIKISIDNIYQSEEVIDKEIAGYQIINKLLGVYTNAVNHNFDGKASNYDKLVLERLPKTIDFKSENLYERLLAVCHYVSLLSDSKAILNFKTIEGVTF